MVKTSFFDKMKHKIGYFKHDYEKKAVILRVFWGVGPNHFFRGTCSSIQG